MSIHFNPNNIMKFEWSDETVQAFARVASAGSYGFYKGCKSLENKLDRFKLLYPYNLESTSRYINGATRELIVFEGNFIDSEAHKLLVKVLADYEPMFISRELYNEIAIDLKVKGNQVVKA